MVHVLSLAQKVRTTCSRFANHSLYLMELLSQLSGGNRWREPAVRWFGLSFAPSLSVSNDMHVSIDTPPGFLLTLRFSNITQTETYTHDNTHIHAHTRTHTHTHTNNTTQHTTTHGDRQRENSHVYACVYVSVNVFVLETVTRSKKT